MKVGADRMIYMVVKEESETNTVSKKNGVGVRMGEWEQLSKIDTKYAPPYVSQIGDK